MLTIIVLNWNGTNHLNDCLSSLARQTFRDMEVILVDNGSTDGSVTYIHENFPWVRVIALPNNQGFCGGNNRGIEQARGEYIALLNNDTESDVNWAAEMVFALQQNPQIGFCASKMLLFDQRTILDSAGDTYSISGAGGKRGRLESSESYNEPCEVFGACAGAAVYRKTLFDDIGLLDEDFFLIFEDIDLSFRAQLRGYRCLYVPTARVYHKVNATMGTYGHTYVYYGHRNIEYVFFKNMPYPLIVKGFSSHVLYNVLSFVFFARKGLLKSYIQAKRDAFKGTGLMLQKRKMIQSQRLVSLDYIEQLLSYNWLHSRWKEKGSHIFPSGKTNKC